MKKPVALITGGSRGIGFGCALHLAHGGFDLVIAGRRAEEDCLEALQRLRNTGAEVLYVICDVADSRQRKNLLEQTGNHFGTLNVLVNNAGVAPAERKDIIEASEESFEKVLSTNLKGPYFLTQAVAGDMIAAKASDPAFRGCIINISSVSATVASINRGEYCISKAGVAMATQLWALRLASHDIPVFEVRPGIIATDMTAGVKEKYDAFINAGGIPQRRWGQAEDVGRVVASLARGDFAYSTGQVILVDGGLTLPSL